MVENGTFGDLGQSVAYDCNNIFYDVATYNKRVHRVVNGCGSGNTFLGTIYTFWNTNLPSPAYHKTLTQGHSTSTMSSNFCSYKVTNDQGFIQTHNCSTVVNFAPEEPPIDIDEAEDVAEDNVEYTEFPDMGEWLDKRELFGRLHRDSLTRITYPVLNQFYIEHQTDNIGFLEEIDRLLGRLIDSTTIQNPATFELVLQEIKLLNGSLDSSELYVINEKRINALFLKEMEFGIDSLSEEDNDWISMLAWECPYVAGNAVFKARTMYARLNPMAYFEDLDICNSVGVYKNGSGLFDEENNVLNEIGGESSYQDHLDNYVGNMIMLYPNPADEVLTIKYKLNEKEKAILRLYDMWGRERLSIDLTGKNNITTFSITGLEAGVYTYNYTVKDTRASETGKIVILH